MRASRLARFQKNIKNMWIRVKTNAVVLCVIFKATFMKTSIRPKFFDSFSLEVFSAAVHHKREWAMRPNPCAYDNYLKSIQSSRVSGEGYFCLFPWPAWSISRKRDIFCRQLKFDSCYSKGLSGWHLERIAVLESKFHFEINDWDFLKAGSLI